MRWSLFVPDASDNFWAVARRGLILGLPAAVIASIFFAWRGTELTWIPLIALISVFICCAETVGYWYKTRNHG